MRSRHYDIVRKDYDQSAIWLEAASDLRAAESRIAQLELCWPGEFQIMDQQSHRVVQTIMGPDHNTSSETSSSECFPHPPLRPA